jgi:hypothetical protein
MNVFTRGAKCWNNLTKVARSRWGATAWISCSHERGPSASAALFGIVTHWCGEQHDDDTHSASPVTILNVLAILNASDRMPLPFARAFEHSIN